MIFSVTCSKISHAANSACFFVLVCLLFPSHAIHAAPRLDLIVEDEKGVAIELSQFSDQLVYVDFWASWCGPCRKSFPWMNQMHQKYADQGLTIIAINLDTEPGLANGFLAETPAEFMIAYDPEMQVAGEFDILGMPSSYLFDQQGNLVAKHVGFYRENHAKYEAEIQRWLKNVKE